MVTRDNLSTFLGLLLQKNSTKLEKENLWLSFRFFILEIYTKQLFKRYCIGVS